MNTNTATSVRCINDRAASKKAVDAFKKITDSGKQPTSKQYRDYFDARDDQTNIIIEVVRGGEVWTLQLKPDFFDGFKREHGNDPAEYYTAGIESDDMVIECRKVGTPKPAGRGVLR